MVLGLALAITLGSAAQTATLHYSYAPAQLRCPDEAWLKNAIRARLGRDPFVADASLTLTATIQQDGRGLVGLLKVKSGAARESLRSLSSPSQDCLELASAMELAMTVVIDPLWLASPEAADAKEPPKPEPVKTAEASPEVKPVPAAPPVSPGPGVVLFAEVLGTTGATPGVTGGLGVGAEARWSAFSLGLGARVHLPTHVYFSKGEVSVLLARATVSPCFAFGALEACGALAVGFSRITGTTDIVTRETAPFAAAGLGVSWRFQVLRQLWLRPFVEVEVALSRLVIGSGAIDLWASSPIVGTLGLRGDLPVR